jgi:DNA replication and repair protein RecF
LALRRVRITDFRCLAEVELAFDPTRNYIYGPNGAGKTSILESIFLLGRGRSFRTREIRRLVRRGRTGFAVFGEVDDRQRVRRLGVAFSRGRLEKRIDGEPAAGTALLAEILPVHTIDPGSHELIQGGPSERRRFLDWGVFHVEHGYLDSWRRYRRLLGQRNAALKKGSPGSEVATWTSALAEAGEAVDRSRAAYVAELTPDLAERGKELLDRPLTLGYARGWPADASLADALAATAGRDRAVGNTEVGPHRADLAILLDDRRVHEDASRGQQKLAAASLIVAQTSVFQRVRGASTLLVDDPAAELDGAGLERLIAVLDTVGAQLILTGLTPSQLAPRKGSAVFHVERGELRAL